MRSTDLGLSGCKTCNPRYYFLHFWQNPHQSNSTDLDTLASRQEFVLLYAMGGVERQDATISMIESAGCEMFHTFLAFCESVIGLQYGLYRLT